MEHKHSSTNSTYTRLLIVYLTAGQQEQLQISGSISRFVWLIIYNTQAIIYYHWHLQFSILIIDHDALI